MWNLAANVVNTVASIAADPIGAPIQILTNTTAAVANVASDAAAGATTAVGTAVKGVVQFDAKPPEKPKPAPIAAVPPTAVTPVYDVPVDAPVSVAVVAATWGTLRK